MKYTRTIAAKIDRPTEIKLNELEKALPNRGKQRQISSIVRRAITELHADVCKPEDKARLKREQTMREIRE